MGSKREDEFDGLEEEDKFNFDDLDEAVEDMDLD